MSIGAGLKGDSMDLAILAELFPPTSDPTVGEGDAFSLSSDTLDDRLIDDGGAMLQASSALLRRVNGAVRLRYGSFRPVELSGPFTDSEDHRHAVVAPASIELRPHIPAPAAGDDILPQSDGAPRVALAAAHPDLDDALAIVGRTDPLDWFDLYKLYEIVRDDVDPSTAGTSRKGSQARADRHGMDTKDELSAFTGSADHQGASGQDARHAREPGPAPRRTLTLAEGRSLVTSLLSNWISSLQ